LRSHGVGPDVGMGKPIIQAVEIFLTDSLQKRGAWDQDRLGHLDEKRSPVLRTSDTRTGGRA